MPSTDPNTPRSSQEPDRHEYRETRTFHRVSFAAMLALMLASLWAVVYRVDLTPQVESDFFFSTEDRAFRDSQEIAERFPSKEQLIFSVRSEDRMSRGTLAKIEVLSEELAALPEVATVQSLTSGPSRPSDVEDSPVWSRLLLTDDPRSSQMIVSIEEGTGAEFVERIEEIIENNESEEFEIAVSGVPYVVELIRRHLLRDLHVFSTAAIAVFGLVILMVYRSWPLVVGTLLSCLGACLLALTTLHLLGTPIGILTANIATIVFVLTLSHTVFLTSNWRRLRLELDSAAAVSRAVRITFVASFWCMVAALMGFGSLLLASAKPLRELGVSGITGTLTAITVAYLFYPFFLSFGKPRIGISQGKQGRGESLPGAITAILVLILCIAAGLGISRIDTDPSLLTYFSEGSEIRSGLELVDSLGGSSPLFLVVANPDGQRVDTRAATARLAKAQQAIEEEPSVGAVLSLAVLLEEARRVPFAGLMPPEAIVGILDSDLYDHVASSFVDEERRRALFFLRMRESGRTESRQVIIDRLEMAIDEAGLETVLVGGLYDLQGKMGDLVESSLGRELGGLLFFFIFVAAAVSRSLRATTAMVACLAAIPVLLLGTIGWIGQPVDVISAPGANVAIALGIDAMIHLLMAVRRRRQAGEGIEVSWIQAVAQQRPAIVGAMSILAAGFAIFALSSFPPTRRFGILVATGSLASAVMALRVLPFLGARRNAAKSS